MSIFGMVYTGRKSQILVIFTLNKIFVRHSYLKVSQVVTSIISAAESSRQGALRGSSGSRRQAVLASTRHTRRSNHFPPQTPLAGPGASPASA